MSTKTLLLQYSAAGTADGETLFSLPTPFPTPDANGQVVIPLTGLAGILSVPSLSTLIGSAGFLVKYLSFDFSNEPDVDEFYVGMRQPKPTLLVGGNNITYPLAISAGSEAALNVAPPIRGGGYVPAGWGLAFFVGDASVAATGPYDIYLELEPLGSRAEAAAAIRTMNWPPNPTTAPVIP